MDEKRKDLEEKKKEIDEEISACVDKIVRMHKEIRALKSIANDYQKLMDL
jgi:prefoldin subunit 5